MWRIVFTNSAAKDVEKLKAAHLADKTKSLLNVIREDPYRNPPPYEKLVGDFQGLISRRINIKHRLVYQVFPSQKNGQEGVIKIVSVWSHYER